MSFDAFCLCLCLCVCFFCVFCGSFGAIQAVELYGGAGETALKCPSTGSCVDFAHSYVDFSSLNVTDPTTGEAKQLCSAALGQSFAAGTTDGEDPFRSINSRRICSNIAIVR
jgi:hypothetical protein